MKDYKCLLFDLDGTISDSSVGITKGVAHTLKYYGFTPPPLAELTKFIGPPLSESFERYYGVSRAKVIETERVFREYYDDIGIYENEMYAGMPELLSDMKARGKYLVLASSKPLCHVKRILEYFKIDGYFDYVGGADIEGGRFEKEDVIRKFLDETGKDPSDCLMIGDRKYDIIGAKKTGIDCLCVLYGFGDKKEFEEYGATYVAETVEELCRMLKKP